MLLRVVEDGQFKDINIGEGEMFLLPGAHDGDSIRVRLTIDPPSEYAS